MPEPGYTVIDLETTGLSPSQHHRIIEIGVVYVSAEGQIQDRWSTLVNPGRDVGRSDIHGISARDVLGAPSFADLAPYILRAIEGRTVVAHNAPFDLRFLASELVRSGLPLVHLPLTGLCTMQWSSHFADSPSRKLIDCCATLGVPLGAAHSAAADALAAARLLSHYISSSSGVPPWTPTAKSCAHYAWPAYRGEYTDLRLTGRESPRPERPERWLDLITSGVPRPAEPRVDAYIDVLNMALLDGVLAEHEKAELVAVAREHGLSRGEVVDIHSDYLRALAAVAWSYHVITPKERADLHLVARLLDMPPGDVDLALESVQSAGPGAATSAFRIAGIRLGTGDRVAFTGAMTVERSVWETRSAAVGLVPGSLSRSTAVLVAADPDSPSGKATKARSYGVPIVTEAAFADLLAAID